jgi:hypothetical protein
MPVIVGGSLGVTFPDSTTTPAADVTAQLGPFVTNTANTLTMRYGTSVVGSVGVVTPNGTFTTRYRPQITFTYATNTQNASLNLSSISGYVAGVSDITVTVNSGIYLWSSSTGTPGLNITGGTTGDTLTIVNNGLIMGQGGNGGSGAGGSSGGNAINFGFGLSGATINNTNASAYIGGGGGGGGASNAGGNPSFGGGGGAGGGNGGNSTNGSGGSGGGIGESGSAPSGVDNNETSGGGGGRIFPGTASSTTGFIAHGGQAGGRGGNNTAGGGGGGGSNNAGSNRNTSFGCGGGGGWGASGGSGVSAGGAGGKAVNLNGKTVTWTSGNTTRVWGAVS